MFAAQQDGVSALSLQRAVEMGSYQTAWAMLHRLRSVLVRPGRDRLTGTIEVDETYIGGDEPGLRGGRARGRKALVGIAVEVKQPRGYGRCRMAVLRDGSAASLHPFVVDNLEPGATVITDGWTGYHGVDKLGYVHQPRSQPAARARGEDPGELLPGVHRGGLAGQALAAGHPSRFGRERAPAQLPQRVRVPLQPADSPEPGPGLLPRPRTCRQPPPGALPRPGRRPPTEGGLATAARATRSSSELGPASGGPAVARRLTCGSPLRWIPLKGVMLSCSVSHLVASVGARDRPPARRPPRPARCCCPGPGPPAAAQRPRRPGARLPAVQALGPDPHRLRRRPRLLAHLLRAPRPRPAHRRHPPRRRLPPAARRIR